MNDLLLKNCGKIEELIEELQSLNCKELDTTWGPDSDDT